MDDHREDEHSTGSNTPQPDRKPVTLVKGRHRWSFSCDSGSEASLLRRLSELARSDNVPFDYFDAALVSHQLSRRLKPGLFRIDAGEPDARPAA